jgi:HAD superfamily hydrolase (TIGR01549 family)
LNPKALIFDLDMTLVDSSRLEAARLEAAQDPDKWKQIYRRLGEIQTFPATAGLPADRIPAALRARGKKVAVVTSSHRWYATRVLERFGIEYDVLVAYHDTQAQKPSPEPFNLAVQLLGVRPDECLCVGDDPGDSQAAYHARVPSVGALWRFAANQGDPRLRDFWKSSPDHAIMHPSVLLHSELLEGCRYVGEAALDGLLCHKQDGYRLFWREPTTGDCFECLGRYFSGSDPRSFGSRWSQQILAAKEDHEAGKVFAPALAQFLNSYPWKPERIVPVPPKPDRTSRFGPLLAALAPILTTPCVPVVDSLICQVEIPGYKELNHTAREQAIRGTIRTDRDWTGLQVAVLDDVLTSGATARECARILREAGAAKVRIVALGFAQEIFFRKVCPRCGRSMKRRVRGRDGVPFWGCSGYKKFCTQTLPLSPDDPV